MADKPLLPSYDDWKKQTGIKTDYAWDYENYNKNTVSMPKVNNIQPNMTDFSARKALNNKSMTEGIDNTPISINSKGAVTKVDYDNYVPDYGRKVNNKPNTQPSNNHIITDLAASVLQGLGKGAIADSLRAMGRVAENNDSQFNQANNMARTAIGRKPMEDKSVGGTVFNKGSEVVGKIADKFDRQSPDNSTLYNQTLSTASSLGQMLGDVGISAASGIPVPFLMGIQSGQETYDEAKKQGASELEASIKSTVGGLIEGGSEYIGGGNAMKKIIKGQWKELLAKESEDVAEEAMKKTFGAEAWKFIKKEVLGEAAQEAGTEVAHEVADASINAAYGRGFDNDPNTTWQDNAANIAWSAYGGGLLGAVGGGVTEGVKRFVNVDGIGQAEVIGNTNNGVIIKDIDGNTAEINNAFLRNAEVQEVPVKVANPGTENVSKHSLTNEQQMNEVVGNISKLKNDHESGNIEAKDYLHSIAKESNKIDLEQENNAKVNDEIAFTDMKNRINGGTVIKDHGHGIYEVKSETNSGYEYSLVKHNGKEFRSVYSSPTSTEQLPIENRTFENVGNKKVKAYQYLHPELKSFIQDEATILMGELEATLPAQRSAVLGKDGEYIGSGNKRYAHQDIALIKDLGASYEDIKKAIAAIIKDNGAENYALAKKIELIINDRLTDGYNIMGEEIEPNKEYIKTKEKIEKPNVSMPKPKSKNITEALLNEDGQTTLNKIKADMKNKGIDADFEVIKGGTAFHKDIQKITKGLGVNVVFYKGDKVPNGFVTNSVKNTIFIHSSGDKNDMVATTGHEFLHHFKKTYANEYKELLNFAKTYFTEEARAKYLDTYSNVPELQASLAADENSLLEEMLADEMGNNFMDKGFWQRVYDHSKELFEKLVEAAQRIVKSFTAEDRYETFVAKETAETLSKKFEEAIAHVRKSVAEGKVDTEARIENSDGVQLSDKDQKILNEFKNGDIESTLFSLRDRNLVSLHNISTEKLLKAIELGGMPVPSIAIAKKDIPFTFGGEITLVGNKDLVNPEKNSTNLVYNTDVYSRRMPSQKKEVKSKVMYSIMDKFRDSFKTTDDYLYNFQDYIERGDPDEAFKRLKDTSGVKLQYLKDKGQNIEPPMKDEALTLEYTPEMKDIVKKFVEDNPIIMSKGDEYYDNEKVINPLLDELMKTISRAYVEENYKDIEEIDNEEEIRHTLFRKFSYGSKGTQVTGHSYDKINKDIYKILSPKKVVDTTSLKEKINDNFKSQKAIDEYEAWFKELIDTAYGKKYFETNKKKIPYDIDSIFEYMVGRVKGTENFHPGPGTAKAKGAKKYSNIEDIYKDEDNITTSENVDKFKEEFEKVNTPTMNEMRKYHAYPNGYDVFDDYYNAMGDMLAGKTAAAALSKNYFSKVPKDLQDEFKAIGKMLKDAPVNYFEAKPQRIVRFNEFDGAVVPEGTSEKVIEKLKKVGIKKIVTYDHDSNESRKQAVMSFDDAGLTDGKEQSQASKLFEATRKNIESNKGKEVSKDNTKFSARNKDIKFQDMVVDSYSGQTNSRLSAMKEDKEAGYIDYTEYNDEVSINFINVYKSFQRQGIATQLLQELQNKFPDTEIDWGMTTPDGTALQQATTYTIEDKKLSAKFKELEKIKKELPILEGKMNNDADNDNYQEADGELWDKLYTRQRKLEKELKGKKPTKTLIKTENKASKYFDAAKKNIEEGKSKEKDNGISYSIRSKKFKDWFGDSKVIDSEGNPLIVYHGTHSEKDFTEFSLDKVGAKGANYGEAFYFTSDVNIASGYSYSIINDKVLMKIKKERDEAFENFRQYVTKNKNIDFNSEEYKNLKSAHAEKGIELEKRMDELQNEPHKGEYDTNSRVISAYLSLQNPLIVDAKNDYHFNVNEKAIKEAKEKGNDGVIVKNVIDAAVSGQQYPTDVYITFEPTQIKSATGNNGEYASDNPDIRESIRKKERSHHLQYEQGIATDPEVMKRFSEDAKNYEPISIKGTWNKMSDYVQHNYDEALEEVRNMNNFSSADDVAKAEAVLMMTQEIAKQYDESGLTVRADKQYILAASIAEKINAHFTKAGQTVVMGKLWKMLSPQGVVKMAEKMIEKETDPKKKEQIKADTEAVLEDIKKLNQEGIEKVKEFLKIQSTPTIEETEKAREESKFNELDERTQEISEIFDTIEARSAKKIAKTVTDSLKDILKGLDIGGIKFMARGLELNPSESLGQKLARITEEHYSKPLSERGSLSDKLVKELGINRESADIIAKRVNDKMKEVTKEDKLKALGKAEEKAPSMPKPNKDTEEVSPEDLLADKVINHMKEPKEQEIDAIKDMVNTLYEIAKKTLPEKAMKNARNPMEFITQAIENAEEYKEVWNKAKEIVAEQYADNPEVLDALGNYFDDMLDKPFSDKQLSKAARKELKDLELSYNDLAIKKDSDIQSVIDKIVERLDDYDVSKDTINEVKHYLENEIANETDTQRTRIIDNMFKDKIKGEKKPLHQVMAELYNLGVLDRQEYRTKLNERVSRLIKKALKRNDIDLNQLITKQANLQFEVGQDMKEYLIDKGFNNNDASLLGDYIEQVYNMVTGEAKRKYLEKTFKPRGKSKAEIKSWIDKFIEMSNAGGLSTEDITPLVAAKYNVKVMSPEIQRTLIAIAEKIQSLEKGTDEYNIAVNGLNDYMNSIRKHDVWEHINTIENLFMLSGTKSAVRNNIGNLGRLISYDVEEFGKALLDMGKAALSKDHKRSVMMPQIGQQLKGLKEGFLKELRDIKNDVDSRAVEDSREFGKYIKYKNPFMRTFQAYVKFLMTDRPFNQAMINDVVSRAEKLAFANKVEFDAVEAKQIAEDTASKIFFNGDDKVVNAMLKIRREMNFGKEWGLGTVLFKFVKVPYNISKFAIEREWHLASLKILYRAISTGYGAFKKTDAGYMKDNKFDTKEFLGDVTKGLNGAFIMYIGTMLFNLGLIHVRPDDDDKDKKLLGLEKLLGTNKYQLNLSAARRYFTEGMKKQEIQEGDSLATLDWFTPLSILMIAGIKAEMLETEKDASKEDKKAMNWLLEKVSALATGVGEQVDTVLELPMLQSLRKLKYAETTSDKIMTILKDIPTRFVPAPVKYAKDLSDANARETYADNEWDSSKNLFKAKLPVASKKLEPKLNILGEEIKNNNSLLNVAFNPAIMTKYTSDAEALKMQEVYKKFGIKDQIPSAIETKWTITKKNYPRLDTEEKTIVLSPSEYTYFQQEYGKKVREALKAMTVYTDKDQMVKEASRVNTLYSKVKSKIKDEILEKRGIK